MKLLLLIGIIVCVLLIYIIYKKSKGEDVLNNFYNVIENYDIHNASGTPLGGVDMMKFGETPGPNSMMNNQQAYLSGGGDPDTWADSKLEEPKSDLSQSQKDDLKNYLDSSDQYTEAEISKKIDTRIEDPGGFTDGDSELMKFQKIEEVGEAHEPGFTKTDLMKQVSKGDLDKERDADKTEGEDDLMKEQTYDEQEKENADKLAADQLASTESAKSMKGMVDTTDGDYKPTPIGAAITKCNQLKSCDELTGKGEGDSDYSCGYCANDGYNKNYFGIGTAKGPFTSVCEEGKWANTKAKCTELKDQEKCALANNDCSLIPEEHKELCAYCPYNDKVMPFVWENEETKSGKKLVKYGSDECIQKNSKGIPESKPLIVGEDCLKFAENNPCITPYHATGPHKEKCLRTLWSNSGCPGKKPYERTFADLTSDVKFNKGDYRVVQAKMAEESKNKKSEDIGTVIRSWLNCDNREADVNPCELKYHGVGTYTEKNKVAREYCKRKIWKESGCQVTCPPVKPGEKNTCADGNENPDMLSGVQRTKMLNEEPAKYKQRIFKLPELANTPVPVSKREIRRKAALACYGREPPEPIALKPGFYVDFTHQFLNYKLKGYITEINDNNECRVLWTQKVKLNNDKYILKNRRNMATPNLTNNLSKDQKEKIAEQKKEFGWPGYMNADDSQMVSLSKMSPPIFLANWIPSQYLVEADGGQCEPGITMCGNSCLSILSNLKDSFPTPVDCVIGFAGKPNEWGPWTVCDKECREGGTPGKQTRVKYVLTEPKRGGQSCPPQKVFQNNNLITNPDYLDTKLCVEDVECYNRNFNDEQGETWDYEVGGKHPRGFVDAKGVRITHVIISHNNYIHVQELEIYNRKNINIARTNRGGRASASDLGAPVWQGYPNRAIDGNKSSSEKWPNSNHTYRGGNRWLRVNINPADYVTRVVVYNRPDCCQSRLRGAKMAVWNGGSLVKEFELSSKRKQVYHLKDKNVYNNIKKQGGIAKQCTDVQVPIYYTDDQIASVKNTRFNPTSDAQILSKDGDYYNVKVTGSDSIKRVHKNWIKQGGFENFTSRRVEGFEIGDKVRVANNINETKNVKEGSCMENVFKKSEQSSKGGDCDWHSHHWYGWGSRKWPVKKCAEECLKNPKCNRFTFGKSNIFGGWGLGCRISTGGNGGFCPITTDRYAANGWKWWGQSNLWGGTVYDKIGTKPVSAYKWVGDFHDEKKSNWWWWRTSNRTLGPNTHYAGRVAKWSPGNDAMACSYRCRNHKYFGLNSWGRCYCQNELKTGTQCHDVGRPWWRWYYLIWPWGPRDCQKKYVKNAPSSRGRANWYYYSWYGGFRNKVFKTPKGQIETDDQWKHCSNENGFCAPGKNVKKVTNPEWLRGYRGKNYRGTQTRTRSGYTCQKWTDQRPHRHSNTPAKRKGMGLGTHNKCRNPDNEPGGIWCYTTSSRKRWEYCNAKDVNGQDSRGSKEKWPDSVSGKNVLIRYGQGSKWTKKAVGGGVMCNNSEFGDPYPGKGKVCQYKFV
jgi:hypothetical protein